MSTDWPAVTTFRMYPDAEQIEGLVIYRFAAPLIFANANTFRDEVRRLTRVDPRPRWIVVAAEPITDVDTTAADMLEGLDAELERSGTELVFAEMKDAVRQKIKDYGVDWLEDHDAFYPTIGAAVRAYRKTTEHPASEHPPAEDQPSD